MTVWYDQEPPMSTELQSAVRILEIEEAKLARLKREACEKLNINPAVLDRLIIESAKWQN